MIPAKFVKLCEEWHGGQDSMFYAVSSTGDLKRGTHRPHGENGPLMDHEWQLRLWNKLLSEINGCILFAEDKDLFEEFGDWVRERIKSTKSFPGLDAFIDGYISAALFSETDECGEPLDKSYSREDISPNLYSEIKEDCRNFILTASNLISISNYTGTERDIFEIAGYHFWMTRNHHGVGFWNGDWISGNSLTAIARSFEECYIYVGNDGKIYC